MCVKPNGLSTWKTWGRLTRCGKELPACCSFLDFCPHVLPVPPQQVCQAHCPIWHRLAFLACHQGLLGGGDVSICSGSMDWLAPSTLSSKSRWYHLASASREWAEGLGASLLSAEASKMAQWRDHPPRFSWQGCGQMDICPASPARPCPGESDPGSSET